MAQIIVPETYPVINLNCNHMILPETQIRVMLEGPVYGKLYEDIAAKKHSVILGVLAKPGDNSADRFYGTGVLARAEISLNTVGIVYLSGLYRAKIISRTNNRHYILAKIKPFHDIVEKEYFVEAGHEPVISPKFKKVLFPLLSATKSILYDLVEELGRHDEIPKTGLESLYEDWDKLDLSRRAVLDNLIWNILSVIPEMETEEKQNFIEMNRLSERISEMASLLFSKNHFFKDLSGRKVKEINSEEDNHDIHPELKKKMEAV